MEFIKGLIDKSYLGTEQILIIFLRKGAFLDNLFKELEIQVEYAVGSFKKDIFDSERTYLIKKQKHPIITDLVYFFKAIRNIFTHRLFTIWR